MLNVNCYLLMFLTIHSTVGVIIGEQTNSIWLAFILGFISHFIFDIIPHGDKKPEEKKTIPKLKRWLFRAGFIDGTVMTITLLLIWQNNLVGNLLPVLAGVIGAVAPDILSVLYLFTQHSWLKIPYLIHKAVGDLIEKIEYPVWPGLIMQFAFLSFLIVLLTKL